MEDKINKNICLVWRNLIDDTKHEGLGDKIRGAISVRELCRKNNMNFIIDGTDDVCGKFLKNVHSDIYEKVKTKTEIIHCSINYSEPQCQSIISNHDFSKEDTVYIYTNVCPEKDDCKTYNKDSISEEDKEFGKFLCTPNDEFKSEIDKVISSLPSDYGIQHFRFNDSVFKDDVSIHDSIFINFYNILLSTYTPTDVLISNSNNFKEFANSMLGIKIIKCEDRNCNISHIGQTNKYEDIKPSFIEFYLIANAKYVKTISEYPWVSNFVKWPAVIYNIPLEVNVSK